jgi:hypothetical protein
MKKFSVILLTIAMVLAIVLPACAALAPVPYEDVQKLSGGYESDRQKADGNSITANPHSAMFEGFLFYWDGNNNDHNKAVLLVEPDVFKTKSDIVLTVKNSGSSYWCYNITNDGFIVDGVYAFGVPITATQAWIEYTNIVPVEEEKIIVYFYHTDGITVKHKQEVEKGGNIDWFDDFFKTHYDGTYSVEEETNGGYYWNDLWGIKYPDYVHTGNWLILETGEKFIETEEWADGKIAAGITETINLIPEVKKIVVNIPPVINLGFIGHYVYDGKVMSTSIHWQELNMGDIIDWLAVDAAYSKWVSDGGLAPDRLVWHTSGPAPFTFEDYAEIGFDDFTLGQLEQYYKAYYVATGYIDPGTGDTVDPKKPCKDKDNDNDQGENNNNQGGNNQDGNSQGGNNQDGNSQGGTSQGGNSQGGNSQGGNSQGGNSQGGNSQGGNSQGGNSQGGSSQSGTGKTVVDNQGGNNNKPGNGNSQK